MQLTHQVPAAIFAVLLLAATPAGAAQRSVGAVVQTVPTDDGVDLRLSSGARVHIGFATPDAVRVRMSPSGSFQADVSYAIEGAPPRARAKLTKQGAVTELRSETGTRVTIRMQPDLAAGSSSRPTRHVPWHSAPKTVPSKHPSAATTSSSTTASVKRPFRFRGISNTW
jgi:hypothetical protein